MPGLKKLQSGETLKLADGRVIKLEHTLVYKEVEKPQRELLELFKGRSDHALRSENIEDRQCRFIDSVLIFAARYAHGRNTGAALAVVTALKACWRALTPELKSQLLREADEAQYNHEDWEELKNFAKTFKVG